MPVGMKPMTTIAIGLVAFILLPVAAHAQGSPEAGLELALRTGVAVPFGDIQNNSSLDSYAKSAIPLVVEGGYRFDSNLFAGARFQYGFAQVKNPNGSCSNNNASCGGSVVTLGLEGIYRLQPQAQFAPWLGVGAGYEWSSWDAESSVLNGAAGATMKGFVAMVQGGGDVRVTPQLVLGPFLEASFGRFDTVSTRLRLGNTLSESDSDINDTAWHMWVALGVRGAFGF